jgi:hypothetical protein
MQTILICGAGASARPSGDYVRGSRHETRFLVVAPAKARAHQIAAFAGATIDGEVACRLAFPDGLGAQRAQQVARPGVGDSGVEGDVTTACP